MNTSLYFECELSDVHSSWSHFLFRKIISSPADMCNLSVQLRKSGKGLKIGTKEADTI